METMTAKRLVDYVREKRAQLTSQQMLDKTIGAVQSIPGAALNVADSLGKGTIEATRKLFGMGPSQPAVNYAAAEESKRKLLNDLTLQHMAGIGTAALGVGAGVRGIQGLLEAAKARKAYKFRPGEGAFPYPVKARDNEKQAQAAVPPAEGSILQNPLYGLGVGAAGIGGVYAGYKGMDALLDMQREKARQDELAKAKGDYEKALLSSFPKPFPAKMASDNTKSAAERFDQVFHELSTRPAMEKVGRILDEIYEELQPALEKVAQAGAPAPAADPMSFNMANPADWLGLGLNGLGVYALGSGLLGGAAAYDYATNRSREKALERAVQQRSRQRLDQHPIDIVPEPQEVPSA